MNEAPDHDADASPREGAQPDTSSPNNIVLTGFMGSGKSTVGKLLADRLGLEHIDTDQLIERRHGPIPRIFDQLGEDGFRCIEREIAEELANDVGYVISTGGRFMLDEGNAELLADGNRIFCLIADIEVIFERVMRRRGSRPMLSGPNPRERVEQLLQERAEGYARFEAVHTDEQPPSVVVAEIVRRLDH